VVDLEKRDKEYMIFKVDLRKDYDSVSWSFLDYMFTRFGFDEKWRGWMRAYVYSKDLSVLVNESSTEEMKNSKGIKQSDPLAHFSW